MTVHIFNYCTQPAFRTASQFSLSLHNLQDENQYEIYDIYVTAENKEIDYQFNFFL